MHCIACSQEFNHSHCNLTTFRNRFGKFRRIPIRREGLCKNLRGCGNIFQRCRGFDGFSLLFDLIESLVLHCRQFDAVGFQTGGKFRHHLIRESAIIWMWCLSVLQIVERTLDRWNRSIFDCKRFVNTAHLFRPPCAVFSSSLRRFHQVASFFLGCDHLTFVQNANHNLIPPWSNDYLADA